MNRNHAHRISSAIYLFALTTTLWPASSACGQSLPHTTKAPVAYSNTWAVLAIDTEHLELPATAQQSSQASVQHLSRTFQAMVDRSNQLSDNHTAYVAFDLPYGSQRASRRIVLHKGERAAAFWTSKNLGELRAEVDGCLIMTLDPLAPFVAGDTLPPSHAKTWAKAESHVRAFPVRYMVAPPEYLLTTLSEMLPRTHQAFGGIATTTLTHGLKWAAFGLDPSTFKLEGVIQSASQQDAEALAVALPKLLPHLLDLFPENQRALKPILKPLLAGLLDKMQVRVNENQILLTFPTLNQDSGVQLLAEAALPWSDPVLGAETINKLRAIQLAILNYESANACFPPSQKQRDENGKSGLSWRVHILPYLGKTELALWREFHLDEPWDSEHNRKLLPRMPEAYRSARWLPLVSEADQVAPTKTVFLAPQGEGTILGQDEVVRLRDITDGTSRTLTVVCVKPEHAQAWTAPDDYRFDPKSPATGLAFDATGKSYGVWCDGSVRALQQTWPAEQFLRLFQRNDGQPTED